MCLKVKWRLYQAV